MEAAALKPSQCALPAAKQMSEIQQSNKLHFGAFQRKAFFSIVVTDSHYRCAQMKELVAKLLHSPLHSLSEPNEMIKGLHCVPAGGKNRKHTDGCFHLDICRKVCLCLCVCGCMWGRREVAKQGNETDKFELKTLWIFSKMKCGHWPHSGK